MAEVFAGGETEFDWATCGPFDDVIIRGDSVLAHALRRVRREIDDQEQPVAFHQNNADWSQHR
ncbi:hypothetical protein F0L68_15220 [Solihabitans fulvus]|uniref:Uncharacterized protein n=1 Tax=Solihabitans fulvus TaxID=1892852 RepID=A0A5B2XFD6_9PSEU|nr:hypothetical protein [Solihabitans fulvus]KAA2261765.1 hypothetical protein F0L68_15220 [Solihabitans fulvus]